MPAHGSHTDLSDEELLQAFREKGDNQWLGYLLQRYTALLLGVALKYLKNRDHAEDAVQQIFLKALMHLPKEPISNFKGWLYILMRNHCLQELREKSHVTDEAALTKMATPTADKEELMWREYSVQQLNEAIEQLSEEQRRAVVLFYLERHSYEQIIERTGYTFMQVKSYIQNGRRNLKTLLIKKLGGRGR